MFDWTEESKERYWKIAEERIKDAGLEGIIKIDRLQFSTIKDNVKVHIQPIHTRGNFRVWASVKRLEGFTERKPNKNTFGKAVKPIFYHGWFTIPMAAGEENKAQ